MFQLLDLRTASKEAMLLLLLLLLLLMFLLLLLVWQFVKLRGFQ